VRPIGSRVSLATRGAVLRHRGIFATSDSTVALLAVKRSDTSYMVKFCLDKAVECRRGADRAVDPIRKRSLLEMEGQWFFLARSYDNARRARAVRGLPSAKVRST
jgi:hypothetical protein